MKKTLIALAAVAATASFAQSSVQITGTFDPSVANSKTTYGDSKSVSNTFIRNNSQGTSQITFKGTEDLGGGLKASFLLENDFDTRYDANGQNGVTADGKRGVNLGSGGGEQYLALEGGFGKIAAGSPNTPSLTAQASRQPFGTKIGGGFNGVLGTGHVRSNNSIVYSTPVFSGFSAAVAYGFKHNAVANNAVATPDGVQQANTNTGASSTNGAANANQTSITDIGLNYANGPLAVGFSSWTTAQVTSVAGAVTPKVQQNNLYASYDLGVAKLAGGYHTEKNNVATNTTGVDAKGWNVAATVPLSANLSLLANYAQLDDKLAARAAASFDKKITAIGVKYTLSKNTSVYARYVDEKNDNILAGAANLNAAKGATTGNTAAAVKTTLVGMQTNF